jgi:hypothetical protein
MIADEIEQIQLDGGLNLDIEMDGEVDYDCCKMAKGNLEMTQFEGEQRSSAMPRIWMN